jgi:hypothetical protein
VAVAKLMIRVRFACGHEGTVSETAATAPICGCGETQVTRTVARAPRFVGACTGPYADTQAIAPGVVDVAPGGPLRITQES